MPMTCHYPELGSYIVLLFGCAIYSYFEKGCRKNRLQNSPYFCIFKYARASNKRCGTRLKTESETGENATIPKGIVGSFEFNVLQRNLREWHERPWIYVCEC